MYAVEFAAGVDTGLCVRYDIGIIRDHYCLVMYQFMFHRYNCVMSRCMSERELFLDPT